MSIESNIYICYLPREHFHDKKFLSHLVDFGCVYGVMVGREGWRVILNLLTKENL